MAPLALTLLGGFQARLGSGPALSLPTKKAQALLAYLARTHLNEAGSLFAALQVPRYVERTRQLAVNLGMPLW